MPWWCLLLPDALQLLLFPCHYFIPLLSHLCASELQLVKSLMRNIPPCLTQASTLLLFRESLKVSCRAKEQPQDWKKSVFFSIPKKGNAKECSNYRTIALISQASKVMLKILQAFSNMWTVNFLMFKLVLEKAEKPEIKLPTSYGSSKMQESSSKTSISALLTMPKPLTVWITTNWKILKEMGIPDHLTCLLRNLYACQ